jgi:hypothetical protein
MEQPPWGSADLRLGSADDCLEIADVSGSAIANDSRCSKSVQDGSSGLVMPNFSAASLACARNCLPVSANAAGADPMTRYSRGSRPAACRWNNPGSSLRLAKSPVAPNSTITWFSGRRVASFLVM